MPQTLTTIAELRDGQYLGKFLAIFMQYLVHKFNICDINTLTPFQLQLRDGLCQQAPQQHQGDPAPVPEQLHHQSTRATRPSNRSKS